METTQPYRSGSPGRFDVNGVEWHACDPYPTWYRYEGGTLFTSGSGVPVGAVVEYPADWADGGD